MTRPRKATEADFTTFVIDLARALGWRTAHFRPAKTDKGWRTPVQGDGKGFPDLVLSRGGRLIFAELKSARGRLGPEQVTWLAVLGDVAEAAPAAVETFVWRPADVDEIRAVLAR